MLACRITWQRPGLRQEQQRGPQQEPKRPERLLQQREPELQQVRGRERLPSCRKRPERKQR